MGVEPVQIRKGVWMFPVFDIKINHITSDEFDPASSEIFRWLWDHGLENDPFSKDWTYYWSARSGVATFLFKDPNMAMLFKLTWA